MTWQESLWYVVDEAARKGVSPEAFLAEVRESWKQSLSDRLRDEPKVFSR